MVVNVLLLVFVAVVMVVLAVVVVLIKMVLITVVAVALVIKVIGRGGHSKVVVAWNKYVSQKNVKVCLLFSL